LKIKLAERVDERGSAIQIAREEIYDDVPPYLVTDWLRNSGNFPFVQWFIAEEDYEIIGFIVWAVEDIYEDKIVLEISWMAVDEDSQRLGIGTNLIRESLPKVKASFPNIKKFLITVVADDEISKSFYRKTLSPYFEGKEPEDRIRFYAST
jgi:GNAT superfamily N-acetyltransferase